MVSSSRSKFVMELVGTAILLLTIQLADGVLMPVAIGGVLMAIIYAGGPISGGHYNPAVSLAVHLRGGLPSVQEMCFTYMVPQLIGGYVGSLVGGFIHMDGFSTISVGKGYSTLEALLAELVFTFLLCFVVLLVATHSEAQGNHYFGASIGLVVMVGAETVGHISGGSFNPAVGMGLTVSALSFGNVGYVLETIVINFLGGAAAAGCFYLVAPDQFEASSGGVGETTLLL